MGKVKRSLDPEARTKRCIALAYDNAEQRLLNGTASAQLIVHFLKLETEKTKLENEILSLQRELVSAKTDAIKSSKESAELYENALKAMRKYQGVSDDEETPDIF